MNEVVYKEELIAGLRQGLEEGMVKEAGVALSESEKAFIEHTMFEFEKSAGFGEFVKNMYNTAVSTSPTVLTESLKENTLDTNGHVTRVSERNLGLSNAARAGTAMAEGFGAAIPRALVPLGVGMGVLAAMKAVSAIGNQIDKNKFDKAFAQVLINVPSLKEYDPVRVQNIAQSIFRLAPHIATDPLLLGQFIDSQVKNAAGIDPQTLRSLIELEDKIKGRSSFGLKPKELQVG